MAFALVPHMPAHVDRPALVQPAAREISFGRVRGTVGRGTARVVVLVDGERRADEQVDGRRFDLRVKLPMRDAQIRVVAEDALGNHAETRVEPVLGLPAAEQRVTEKTHEDAGLQREVDDLVDAFPGIAAVYVQNLETGAGAAWNARARFPAASTVKLAIAIEVLRALEEKPAEDSDLDNLLSLMLIDSDNNAANELLAWLGGSETSGAERVNGLLAALDVEDTHLYGGFLVANPGPIPLTIEREPEFEGKYTTAWDLAQLHRDVHLAAGATGPLTRIDGDFTPSDARFLLWILAHSADTGKLDRYVGSDAIVPHKAGWVTEARHDAGIIYAPEGAFVAAVMTYTGSNAGVSSDELAGRIAEAARKRFETEREEGAGGTATSSVEG
jgi:beta-lactamase class A